MLMHKPCIFFRCGSIEIYGVKQQIDVYGLTVNIIISKNNDNKYNFMNMGMTKKKD